MKNYYEVLGVPETASDEDIKRAYRALAKRWHPDKNAGNKAAEEKFKEILEAYNTLTDPLLRSQHDRKLQYKHYYSGAYVFTEEKQPKHRDPARPDVPEYSEAFKKWQMRRSAEHIKRRKRILVGMIAMFICFMGMAWVFSYYREQQEAEEEAQLKKQAAAQIALAEQERKMHIETLDSPYDTIFGPGVYHSLSYNSITVTNGPLAAVVCLQETQSPFRTIRNDYIEPNMSFGWKQVPDGEYFIKVYLGSDWSMTKSMADGHARGGFTKNELYLRGNILVKVSKAKTDREEDRYTEQAAVRIPGAPNAEYDKIFAEDFFR